MTAELCGGQRLCSGAVEKWGLRGKVSVPWKGQRGFGGLLGRLGPGAGLWRGWGRGECRGRASRQRHALERGLVWWGGGGGDWPGKGRVLVWWAVGGGGTGARGGGGQ